MLRPFPRILDSDPNSGIFCRRENGRRAAVQKASGRNVCSRFRCRERRRKTISRVADEPGGCRAHPLKAHPLCSRIVVDVWTYFEIFITV